MVSENQYVTKKEFYSVAVSISLLILFTNTLAVADNAGIGNLYMAIWATVLVLYYSFKLHMAIKCHKVTQEFES